MFRTIAARLAALERHPGAPGAPLVLYPREGESTTAALARYGYTWETVGRRPVIVVMYEDTHPHEEP